MPAEIKEVEDGIQMTLSKAELVELVATCRKPPKEVLKKFKDVLGRTMFVKNAGEVFLWDVKKLEELRPGQLWHLYQKAK